MRVWVDGQCFQTTSAYRGIGRYMREFLSTLNDEHPEIELIVSLNGVLPDHARAARRSLSRWLPRDRLAIWHGVPNDGESREEVSEARRLSAVALGHHVRSLSPDIVVSASPFEGGADPTVPLLDLNGIDCASIAMFYDAIPHRYPDQYFTDPRTRAYFYRRLEALSEFDQLIAISDFARAEAKALVPGCSVSVIDAGVSGLFLDRVQAMGERSGTETRPYVLYVGGFDWRKNVPRLLRAFHQLPETIRREHALYLVGYSDAETRGTLSSEWAGLGLADEQLVWCGHVDDVALVALYRQAKLVVQPSLMEGFGLTALEAMACDVPVIASRGSALDEVLALPGLATFDPLDPLDLSRCMGQVLSSPELCAELVSHGQQRLRKYTWQRTAQLAYDVMTELHETTSESPIAAVAPDIRQDTRKATLDQLSAGLKAHPLLPGLLGIAEPLEYQGRRLLVDVTMTAKTGLKTGIQRVVRRLAAAWESQLPQGFTELILIYADDESGWYQVFVTPTGELSAPSKDVAVKVILHPGDLVLMLDSSWEFHEVHSQLLDQAHLADIRIVSVLYDLLPLNAPAFFHPNMSHLFSDWLEAACRYSDGFVCISETVASDFSRFLDLTACPYPLSIGHWRLGADPAAQPPPKKGNADGVLKCLVVGTIEPRKGHLTVIRALEMLNARGVQIELVVIGRVGWGGGYIADVLKQAEARGLLQWHDDLDDESLGRQYSTCDVLIAASFSEGFGLPLAEAAQAGKSIIASDIPPFREIGRRCSNFTFFPPGDAGLLVDRIEALADGPDPDGSSSSWIGWAQSAHLLGELLNRKTWPDHYWPSAVPILDGWQRQTMSRELTPAERRCELTLVEGPQLNQELGSFVLIVRVSNRSNVTWHGQGCGSANQFAVGVSCQLLDRYDCFVENSYQYQALTTALGPGDSQFIRLILPADRALFEADTAVVNLTQRGVSWSGAQCSVPLL